MNRHKAQAIIACILAGMTWSRPAGAAPIQADPQADSRHKPQILQTASGIPLVQIAAPRNGLSHNKYQDFSVTEKGAILNNSFTLTKTRLAGLVQGNSNMAGGAARVILNEVTGNNLSNLNGFLEVAGNKADVILANPNGIAVNGGGFLNTSRALLTTGRPVFGANGKLEQFRVERGQVTIDGNGLDGKEADSVTILSRAARINAGIWAKKLQITTGQNQIDAGSLQPTVLDTQSENKPEVALDVAAVGGMYAGSIYLVGTEKGLGVNLFGAVQADGKITVDVDGRVHVQKELTGGDVQLQGENIRNEGWITSGKNLELKAQEIEDAGGTLTAGGNAVIRADKADLRESHTYAGNRLELAADSLSIDKAALHGEKGVEIQAKAMPLNGNITSKGNIRVQVEQDLTNADSADGYGNVQAAGDVVLVARRNGENRKKIESGGTLTFQSGDKLVNSGEISSRQIQAKAREIRNTGVISADEQVGIEGGTLTNESGGRIYGDGIAIRAGQVVNRREEAKEQELAEAVEELRKRESDLEKQVRKDVTAFRSDAEVQAYEDGIQAAGKAYDQQKNRVDALKQELEKTGTGTIAAREQLSITAESIQNSADSLLYSGGTLDLQAAGEAVNLGGRVESQGNLRITAQTLRNENDLFSAKRVVGTLEENPERIRIDQAGHPEQGQTFVKSEFSNLGSGYGASHQGEAADVKIHDLTFIRTKSQTSHKEVTESRPGVITSGGMLTITGAVKNVDSQLVAGDTLHIQGTLENQAQKEQECTVTFGTTQGSYTYKRGWPHKFRRRGYKDKVFMTPQVEQGAPAPLGISQVAENKGKAPEMQEIGKEKRQDAASFLDPFGASLTRTEQGRTKWQNLLQGSLYLVHPESTARYLMETDPKFTSRKQILSSDYFFQQLQWDPDKVPKRLGDGFYERMLVRQQILDRTGNRYLEGYSDEESEFRALMDAGVLYAQKTGLQPGIVLSEAQMTQLTSDMVWLENRTITYEGKPYEVLIPRVYLRPNRELELKADGSLVSGKKLWVETKAAIANEGTLQGKEVILEAGSLKNRGILQGDSLFAHTRGNLESTGTIRGKENVELAADRALTVRSTKDTMAHQDVVDQVAGIAVAGKAGVLLLQSGKDLKVSGAVLQNLGEQGKTILKAGSSLQLGTLQLSSDKDMTLDSKNYLRTQRRTEMGTTVEAAGDVRLEAGDDMTLKAAQISSTQGEVELQAGGDLTLEAGKAFAGDQYALSHRERSLLGSRSTEIRTDEQHETVLGSALSGKSLMAKAGNNLTLRGTSAAADGDIHLQAGGDLSLDTVDQKDISEVYQKTKRKGIMGAGMGILIGSEKKSGQVQQETHTQVGSMVGSLGENVNLEAGNRLQTRGSSILAGKDITLSGTEIQVENAEDTYHYQEKQEYRRTGLTASLGGDYMDAAGTISTLAQRASTVRDGRLAALYGTEAALSTAKGLGDIQKSWDAAQKAAQEYRYANIFGKGKQASEAFDKMKAAKEKLPFVGKTAVTLNLGMGTQHSSHAVEVNGTRVSGSQVLAGGNVTLKAGGKDILLKGSQVSGQNVDLSAGENILLQAGKNQETIQEKNSAKGGNVGISMGRTGLVGISAEGGMVKGTSQEEKTSYTNASVKADQRVTFTSGKDTHLAGGILSGEIVNGQVSGNLQLESLQDTHTYREKRKSAGLSADYGLGAGMLSGMGSLLRENTESRYQSVKEQTGIYAGRKGFALEVGKETGLKGAVISSQAEAAKNTLSTGTLRYEDMRNEAAYRADGVGIQESFISASKDKNPWPLNERGITPIEIPDVKKSKGNITKSGISQGKIRINEKGLQQQDVTKMNRDTNHSLQILQEIFNKTKVKEKQELIAELGKLGNQTIHIYSAQKGWKDGSNEKILAHSIFGSLLSDIAGGKIATGVLAGGINEFVIRSLNESKGTEWVRQHPDLIQWISAAVGTAVGRVSKEYGISKNITVGAIKDNLFMEGRNAVLLGFIFKSGGFGHIGLIAQDDNGVYGSADYGRYGNDVEVSIGEYPSPVGTGTFITGDYFDPDDKDIFIFNKDVIDAQKSVNLYNQNIIGSYKELTNTSMFTNTDHKQFYRMEDGSEDYNLVSNNCVTTSIQTLSLTEQGKNNEAASSTFEQLQGVYSPMDIVAILRYDYYKYQGKGLVSWIGKGEIPK